MPARILIDKSTRYGKGCWLSLVPCSINALVSVVPKFIA